MLKSIIAECAAHQATAHVFSPPHNSDGELFTYSSHGWQAKSEGVSAQARLSHPSDFLSNCLFDLDPVPKVPGILGHSPINPSTFN